MLKVFGEISPQIAGAWLYFGLWLALLFWRWKYFPETQGLVPSTCHQCLSIRAHSEVKYSVCMASEYSQLFHLWLFPYNYLIFRISMCAYQFIYILRVYQVAYLTASIHPVHRLACESVPESNASICCTTSTAHSSMLVWRPSNGFHSCNMISKLHQWFCRICLVPYH